MKIVEYNNLLESLYVGHEFSFTYKNRNYFLERINEGYALYDVSNLLSNNKTGTVVCEIKNNDLIALVNDFMSKQIFDGSSFNEIYDKIEIIDIE